MIRKQSSTDKDVTMWTTGWSEVARKANAAPSCYNEGDFYKYFKENMDALNAPVPEGLFDTYAKATVTAGLLASALHTLGSGATAAELFGATVSAEKVMVLAAIGAAAYVGVVIGSIAVASGRSLSCGTSISDLFVFIRQNNLEFKDWDLFYQQNPEILDRNHHRRKSFAARSRAISLQPRIPA